MAEQGDLTQLALQIAQLQAGDPNAAMSNSLSYGNQVESANQFNANLAQQQQQYNQTYALQQQAANKADTQIISSGGHNYLVNTQTGAKIADLGATGSGTGSTALKTSDYMTALNSGITSKKTLSDLVNQFSPYLPLSTIVTQYNALSPYGTPKEDWAQALLNTSSNLY